MFDFLKKVPLFANLPDEDLDRLCELVTEEYLSADVVLFTEGEIGNKSGGSDSKLPTAQIDLSEGVLTTNCGVPIIVCCNKAEVIGEESNSSSGNNCTTSVSIY